MHGENLKFSRMLWYLAAVCWWAPVRISRAAIDDDSLHLVCLAASDFVNLLLFLIF